MATITNNGTSTNDIGYSNNGPRYIEEVIDIAAVIAAGVTPGSTDTIQMLNLPADTYVMRAGIEVLTAETGNATATVSLGDTDVDHYVAATIVTVLGQKTSIDINKLYTSADTIDLTSATAALTNAKLRVWAIVQSVNGLHDAQVLTFT